MFYSHNSVRNLTVSSLQSSLLEVVTGHGSSVYSHKFSHYYFELSYKILHPTSWCRSIHWKRKEIKALCLQNPSYLLRMPTCLYLQCSVFTPRDDWQLCIKLSIAGNLPRKQTSFSNKIKINEIYFLEPKIFNSFILWLDTICLLWSFIFVRRRKLWRESLKKEFFGVFSNL